MSRQRSGHVLATADARAETANVVIETSYTRTADGTFIAYQVTGAGVVDLVVIRTWMTNLEHEWQEPVLARMYRRLGAIGRVIRLDRRGSGLSDRIAPDMAPAIEERIDDIRAVMDAVGSERAVLIGLAAAGQVCAVFAAMHPERTAGLVVYEGTVRDAWAPDYPSGSPVEEFERDLRELREAWGTLKLAEQIVRAAAPSRAEDDAFIAWLADDMTQGATPDEAAEVARLHYETDVRAILPAVHVPTLVLTRSHAGNSEQSRDLAARIAGSVYVELPGNDHMSIAGDTDAVVREIARFADDLDDDAVDDRRILATLLFTDIVGSTRMASSIGDRRWSELLESHERLVRQVLGRHRGRLVDTAGDGVFAAFDGPARAVRCAVAVVEESRRLGLEIRAGVHTGECENVEGRLRGLAVHVAARIAALAESSEVLVSGTVTDLVAGSGLGFESRGEHTLAGVPGTWRVHAVAKPS